MRPSALANKVALYEIKGLKMNKILIWIMFVIFFVLIMSPLGVASFAKAFGSSDSLLKLIKEAYIIELKLFRIIK